MSAGGTSESTNEDPGEVSSTTYHKQVSHEFASHQKSYVNRLLAPFENEAFQSPRLGRLRDQEMTLGGGAGVSSGFSCET